MRSSPRPTRRTGRKVLYFVDVYANWYDVQLAEALVAVLEHNGVAVYVHPAQKQSGMWMVSMGALDQARRLAAHNIAILAEAVRQGYHIVCTEPSAARAIIPSAPSVMAAPSCTATVRKWATRTSASTRRRSNR